MRFPSTRSIIIVFGLFVGGISCKKLVEIPSPKNAISSSTLFKDDASATSALLGIYSQMSSSSDFASGGPNSITYLSGYSADELEALSDADSKEFYLNQIRPANYYLTYLLWSPCYQYIYTCNTIIEQLQSNTAVSENTKNILTGEAHFIRAFCYFYLVNLWGDVPLIVSSDYHLNMNKPRTAASEVYSQIMTDLENAVQLLPENYIDGSNAITSLRIRPNKWAAKSFLSRVELYQGHWERAETLSSEIIDHADEYSLEPDLNLVFLNTSKEAIWQLQPNFQDRNTNEAEGFIPEEGSLPYYAILTPSIYAGFQNGDRRRQAWIDSLTDNAQIYYYPYKYKHRRGPSSGEYSTILRLAEQYLIRAEARIQQQKINEGIDDLNIIRFRARDTSAIDQLPALQPNLSASAAMEALIYERKVELFTEWGHRWFDLKRLGLSTDVLSPLKSSWTANDTLYPIPQYEITSNYQLTQNPGY